MDLKHRRLNTLQHILRPLAIMLGIGLMLASCNRPSRNLLFDTPRKYEKMNLPVVRINSDSTENTEEYLHRISTDDRIRIRFINDIEFANELRSANQSSDNGILFVVDQDGNINMPLLGKIYVQGKTRQEVQDMLLVRFNETFTNPSIEVTLVGLSVSVQGEVTRPDIYPLEREKTTLVEVLAQAGGITQYGKKRVVKIIRGVAENKEPEILIFDLTQLEAIETTEMILRDKDIVYVEPREIRVLANAITPYSSFLALLSSVGSIAVITYSLLRTTN